MKILQVTNFFKPSWEAGGVARVSFEISKQLIRLGHEITVYTTNFDKIDIKVRTNEPVSVDKIRVYYFENFRKFFYRITTSNYFIFPLYSFFIARKEIRNYNIIHIHEHRTFLSIIVHYFAVKNGIPYVIQSHGSVLSNNQKENFKKIFDFLWGNQILSDASAFIALSESEMKQYLYVGVPQQKINIIPNGINIHDYDLLPKYGLFRKKYGLSDTTKIILFLGRINWIKGIDILIDAFKIVTSNKKNVVLIVAGPDGGLLHSIKEKVQLHNIEDKVIFTGPLYNSDKLSAYVDADFLVLPSRYETFPMTVLESCMCKTPVIVTNRCGIADIINNNVGSVADANSEDLSNKIIDLLSDKYKYDFYKARTNVFVSENFNMEKITNKIIIVYNKLLQS